MAKREALRELQIRLAKRLQAAQSEGMSVDWLAVKAGGAFRVGTPYVDGAVVEAEVMDDEAKGPKLTVFKFKNKSHYKVWGGEEGGEGRGVARVFDIDAHLFVLSFPTAQDRLPGVQLGHHGHQDRVRHGRSTPLGSRESECAVCAHFCFSYGRAFFFVPPPPCVHTAI